jgi:hypothetical protein
VRGWWLENSNVWHALPRCAPITALSTQRADWKSQQPIAHPQKRCWFPRCEVQLCANHTDPSL